MTSRAAQTGNADCSCNCNFLFHKKTNMLYPHKVSKPVFSDMSTFKGSHHDVVIKTPVKGQMPNVILYNIRASFSSVREEEAITSCDSSSD